MSVEPGILYVVATPVGNLGDLSPRAADVLRAAAVVAAEDTRHTAILLREYGISVSMISLHEHNEAMVAPRLIRRIESGESIALVSDAGTPLLSDPGFQLVRGAHLAGITVSPVPGPSAVTAALSVSGLPTARFAFEGFLPSRRAARIARLRELRLEPRTLVFFESPRRVLASLENMQEVFGGPRLCTVARELTKRFEEVRLAPFEQVVEWLRRAPEHCRGEFVIMVAGCDEPPEKGAQLSGDEVLAVLLADLPVKQAARLASRLTGLPRNELYRRALELTSSSAE